MNEYKVIVNGQRGFHVISGEDPISAYHRCPVFKGTTLIPTTPNDPRAMISIELLGGARRSVNYYIRK